MTEVRTSERSRSGAPERTIRTLSVVPTRPVLGSPPPPSPSEREEEEAPRNEEFSRDAKCDPWFCCMVVPVRGVSASAAVASIASAQTRADAHRQHQRASNASPAQPPGYRHHHHHHQRTIIFLARDPYALVERLNLGSSFPPHFAVDLSTSISKLLPQRSSKSNNNSNAASTPSSKKTGGSGTEADAERRASKGHAKKAQKRTCHAAKKKTDASDGSEPTAQTPGPPDSAREDFVVDAEFEAAVADAVASVERRLSFEGTSAEVPTAAAEDDRTKKNPPEVLHCAARRVAESTMKSTEAIFIHARDALQIARDIENGSMGVEMAVNRLDVMRKRLMDEARRKVSPASFSATFSLCSDRPHSMSVPLFSSWSADSGGSFSFDGGPAADSQLCHQHRYHHLRLPHAQYRKQQRRQQQQQQHREQNQSGLYLPLALEPLKKTSDSERKKRKRINSSAPLAAMPRRNDEIVGVRADSDGSIMGEPCEIPPMEHTPRPRRRTLPALVIGSERMQRGRDEQSAQSQHSRSIPDDANSRFEEDEEAPFPEYDSVERGKERAHDSIAAERDDRSGATETEPVGPDSDASLDGMSAMENAGRTTTGRGDDGDDAARNDGAPDRTKPYRLGMILGPILTEDAARLVGVVWGLKSRGSIPRSALGEILAEKFRINLYADLTVVFEGEELEHHVLRQTPNGELWLVSHEQRDRFESIVSHHSGRSQALHVV